MPHTCCVPGCSKHALAAKIGIPFHSFPRDEARRREWLRKVRNTRLPVTSTFDSLKSSLVCGKHFVPSDYERDLRHECIGTKLRHKLKDTAVPSSFPWSAPSPSPPPRSAYVKRQKVQSESASEPAVPATVEVPLPQPGPSSVSPGPSLTTCGSPEQLDPPSASASSDSEYDPSDREMESESDSASEVYSDEDEPFLDNCQDRIIADVNHILQLFRRCQECGKVITEQIRVRAVGAQVNVHWECVAGHSGHWMSGPLLRGMPAINLRLASAIFFSGTTHRKTKQLFDFVDLQCIGRTTYNDIQSSYILPVTNDVFVEERNSAYAEFMEDANVSLIGDGRSDSPGFNAKYTTYTVMEEKTSKIVDMELLQVTEATSSVAMEVEGFERCVERILDNGVDFKVMTTDRSPSIRKKMKTSYKTKKHEFDCWHVGKGTKRKVNRVGQRSENRALLGWARAVSNHLWFCSAACNGDEEKIERMWLSLLHHIQGIHSWRDEDGNECSCSHAPLSAYEQQHKLWLEADSPAFHALEKIVKDPRLIKDIRQMTLFKHTSILESFHSTMTKFAPKRQHFHFAAMQGRMQLAVIDHNSNLGREQSKTKEGAYQWRFVSSKHAGGQWVAKKKFVNKSFIYVFDMIDRVFARRLNKQVSYKSKESHVAIRPLPQNIAKTPRPPTEEILAARHPRP